MELFVYRGLDVISLSPDDPVIEFLRTWQHRRVMAKLAGERDVVLQRHHLIEYPEIHVDDILALECVEILSYDWLPLVTHYFEKDCNTWRIEPRVEDLFEACRTCPAGSFLWVDRGTISLHDQARP
jgi:hypothetical protein